MVEFTDLQCPFCRQFAITSFDEIKKNWIDTGKLRYISRDFPLDFHAQAMPAARAARCAGEQGKFWEMRLALVRNANLLTADYIKKTAADLKLDAEAVRGLHSVDEVRRRDPGGAAGRHQARRRRHADVRHRPHDGDRGRRPDAGRRPALRAIRREAERVTQVMASPRTMRNDE